MQTKPLCASSSNLADMLTMVNTIYFGGHSSNVKVTMVIIDKCGVRGDATLCVVIFSYTLADSSREPREENENYIMKNSCRQRISNSVWRTL